MPDFLYTRRQYLLMRALNGGATAEAAEAFVDEVIRNNPMADPDEKRTYRDWQEARTMA